MFVKNLNILKKNSRNIIASFLSLSVFIMVPQIAMNHLNVNENTLMESKTRHYTLKEKHLLFENLGKDLKKHGLRITPKVFADACMVALYCESNLKTTAVG